MVYIARVVNLSFVIWVMPYQTFPVRTTFDTIPRFDTSKTLLSRSIGTLAIVNNKYIFLESMNCRVGAKSVKYNSTKEIKNQVFRFGKGDENVNWIDNL